MANAAVAGPRNCCTAFTASSIGMVKDEIIFSASFRPSQPFPFQESSLQLIPAQNFRRQRQSTVQVNVTVGYPASMTWWKKTDEPNMREIFSTDDFVDALTKAGDKLVLVDFFSIGCRACKAMYPKVCQLAAENPDMVILKVNFYDNDSLCRNLKVNILPFFHFYRGGEGRLDAFSCSLSKVQKLRKAAEKLKFSGRLQSTSPPLYVMQSSR